MLIETRRDVRMFLCVILVDNFIKDLENVPFAAHCDEQGASPTHVKRLFQLTMKNTFIL